LGRRAWHQAHVAAATIRLVSHYLPLQTTFDLNQTEKQAPRGTVAYYLQCIGGPGGLAQLYLEAGLLHLEGAASSLLASSYSSLSSIRVPLQSQAGEGDTEAWRRDRDAAGKYFERARMLQPNLDIPLLPPDGDTELEMPSMEVHPSAPQSIYSGESQHTDPDLPQLRRRRKKEETTLIGSREARPDEIDNTWYLYIPGLVGAGTALFVVGVVGALSFSTWSRRNQGS
jgi:thiamine pyrophosphokinase